MEPNNGSTFVICVPRKRAEGFYRLQTFWNENELKLNLLDDSYAYSSTLTKNDLTKQAEDLKMTYDSYLETVLRSIQNDYSELYFYEKKNDIFFIYRQQNTSNMKIILIKFQLEQITYVEIVETIIDKLRMLSNFYKEKLEVCEKEKTKLLKEKTNIQQKLEKYILLKEKAENDLYSKFALLLNEKKKHIVHLKDLRDASKSSANENKTALKEKSNLKRTHVKKHPDSEDLFDKATQKHEETENNKRKYDLMDDKLKKLSREIKPKRKKEVISDSDSDTEIDEEICVKSTENRNETKQKNLKFNLIDSEDDDLPVLSFKRQPECIELNFNNKIQKATQINENNNSGESQDLEEMFASNELILSMQNTLRKRINSKNNDTESPNFCTQDLLDRL